MAIFTAGQARDVDESRVLGALLEEFMDLPPKPDTPEFDLWTEKRGEIEVALSDNGLRYYRFGRVLPQGEVCPTTREHLQSTSDQPVKPGKSGTANLSCRGLRRAIILDSSSQGCAAPLIRQRVRRSRSPAHDVEALDHRHSARGVSSSLCGSSTRIDFLLPAHSLVIETKLVRDHRARKPLETTDLGSSTIVTVIRTVRGSGASSTTLTMS